jgi:drug/metabolite transporter (DMT)-like permease
MTWVFLSITSAIFSAFSAVLEKKVLFKTKAISFCLIFSFLCFFIMLFLFPFNNYDLISLNSFLILFLKAIMAASAFYFIMRGIKSLEISSSLPIMITEPAVVAIFSFIFLKEVLSTFQIIGVVSTLFGTYYLQQIVSKKGLLEPFKTLFKKGYYNLLIALAFYTTSSILDKYLLTKVKVPLDDFMLYQHLFIFMFFLVLFFFKRVKTLEIKNDFKNYGFLIFIISIFTIIYRYALMYSIKMSDNITLPLSLKRLSVLIAIIIGGKMFNEESLKRKIFATLIMIFGAFLIINS